jgi:bacterioferritin (cytochrome b1)
MKLFKSGERGIPGKSFLYLITGLVVLGLAIINIGVNLIWLGSFANTLKTRSMDYLLTEAARAAEGIEKSIEVEINDIKKLSQDLSVVEDVEFFIYRFLKDNPAIKETSLINLEGEEGQRYSRTAYFTKKDLRDFAFLEEFEKAKKGKTFVSRVDFTEKGEPYIKITIPIRRSETKNPQGVLRVVLYLRGMWAKDLEKRVGQTGRLSVIDDKGMLIADPDPSRVLKRTNLLALPPTKTLILGEIFKGAKYLNEKRLEVIGAGYPIIPLKWGVIIEQNSSELEVPLKKAQRIIAVFLITGLAVIGLLAWLVLTIKKTDRDLIEKDLALEKKTKELEGAKAVLEKRVKVRTKELQELTEGQEETIAKRTKEIEERAEDLEKFHHLAVGRELKMVEMKKELQKLKEKLGKDKEKP